MGLSSSVAVAGDAGRAAVCGATGGSSLSTRGRYPGEVSPRVLSPAAPHTLRHTPRRLLGVILFGGVGLSLLAGCSAPVKVDPAPSAASAACSEVMLSLPEEIDGQEKRTTTSQSTASWGTPTSIVLRCGTPDPGPTSDPCTTVEEVDWIASENQPKDSWTLTAYGRVPGIEVTLDTSKVTSASVATALTESVQRAQPTKRCQAQATPKPSQ